ncbi:hypothetical protein TWF718_004922 [Orbilia javanica]|uniref:Uncharacterized protein n=1 Tax=Orbilia javanica TaxID=47235 RepID=A0AAN8RFX0_9PEZI
MPRVTRSQAAALQNADGREPLEEVTENVKLPEPARRTTRARSKGGSRKENYSVEEQPVFVTGGAGTSSHCAGTSVMSRTTRVTRSQAAKAPDVFVLDEIETIEVTTTRRTRSTRRTRQTTVGGDIECRPVDDDEGVAPSVPVTRGRRASRDSLGAPSKLTPSKIPSPIRPPIRGARIDETPSKLAPADLFAKRPSPAPSNRSTSRSTKKVSREDLLAGKPAIKPFAAKMAAAELPDELELPLPPAISTPLVDRCSPDTIPIAFALPTPLHFAALTPNSKFAPTTPGTKAKKPAVLGSPFTSSPTRKVAPKPSLGSFASPTKAQLARGSTSIPPKPQDGSSRNKPGREQQPAFGSAVQEVKQKGPPSVLLKKAPVIATTKAALLRTQKATGKAFEATVRVVAQDVDEAKTPGLQGPKTTVPPSGSSRPAAPAQPNAVIQKAEPRKPMAPAQTRPTVTASARSAPVRPLVKAQDRATMESVAKTASRPQPRVTTVTAQPKQEAARSTKPQPSTPSKPVADPRSQVPSLLRKPSIPALPKAPAATLSKKPSIPTLPKTTMTPSKKPSVLELSRAMTTPSKKPSVPTFTKVQAPTLLKKPSIPTLPTATALSKKPSVSALPRTTTDLTRKPSIPTFARTTTVLSKKPSVSTLPKSTAPTIPTEAPAPTPVVENPKIEDIKPKESEPEKPAKLVTQKKPFQPVKSTKPLTVPIPFQYDPSNRTSRPVGPSKAQPSQPTVPRASAAVGIKDRMKKFEAPKPKPVVLKDARTLLREMRKEARLGTLPKLTGEVVYAELPQLDDTEATTPVLTEGPPALEPAVASEPIIPVAAISPPLVSQSETLPKSDPPTRQSTHEVVTISGFEDVAPQKTVPLEDFEKLKLAKDRAEAYARGTNAVLNWAAKEMVKRNTEAAGRR